MSSSARNFISRAPRYELTANDPRSIRYAIKRTPGKTYTSRIIDISRTGISFVTDSDKSPQYGEMIKLEFQLTDKDNIAWFAKVVRIEEFAPGKWYMKRSNFESNQVLVALNFHDLPPAYAKLLHNSLEHKFAIKLRQQFTEFWNECVEFFYKYVLKALFFSSLIAMAIGVLYFMSRPDENYDANRGAPWGQRYKNLMIRPDKSNNDSPETQ